MNIIELITQLSSRDIQVWTENDQLRFSAPKGSLTPELRKQLKEHKAELIAFIQKNQPTPISSLPVEQKNLDQPLSYSQERIWFLCQLEPNNSAFYVHNFFEIKGVIDIPRLQKTLDRVVEKHKILRTAYRQNNHGAFQFTLPNKSYPIHHTQMGNQASYDLEELATLHAEDPFNLAEGEVLRCYLYELEKDHYILNVTIHHIATDGSSMRIIANDIISLYQSQDFANDENSAEPALDYIDFANWQRKQSSSMIMTEQLRYWQHELDDVPALLLPCDHSRPVITNSQGASLTFKLDKKITQKLNDLSKENHVTLFMTLFSAYALLLFNYSQQAKFCIGTPISGRTRIELEDIVGCFINMLALKCEFRSDLSFKKILDDTRHRVSRAFANQDIPFEQVVKEIVTQRDLSLTPIFQTLFSLQSIDENFSEKTKDFKIKAINPEKQTAQYDLSLSMNEWNGEIVAEFIYKTELFEAYTIEKMVENFHRLLEQILLHPEKPIFELNLLCKNDQFKQLEQWNQTLLKRTELPSIHGYIEHQARLSPQAIALVFNRRKVNYKTLNEQSNQLAHYLIEQGVEPHDVVGISIDRSIDMVVTLLAILKTGAAYLPLDSQHPEKRIHDILVESKVRFCVIDNNTEFENLASQTTLLKFEGLPLSRYSLENPELQTSSIKTLFNVIYTSGSTGKPKGVMVSHTAMINRLLWMQETFSITHKDRILHKTPITFDVSVWEIFWPLMFGATTVIAEPEGHKNPKYLIRLIQQEAINMMHFVPSMLSAFIQHPDASNCKSMTRIFCSGEVLKNSLVKNFFQTFNNINLYNLYGPTEAAIDVTYHQCQRQEEITPIGKPIANTQIYILDAELKLLPIGAIGEIYIAGRNLAEGYINHYSLTQAAFLANPYKTESLKNEILYKTGDLGRYDANGNIHFIGRKDEQIKIRGFRIELQEIENQLLQHPNVSDACIIAQLDDDHHQYIIAYYISRDELDPDELKAHMANYLPEYMLPAGFIHLNEWPVTQHGKINKNKLPPPTWKQEERKSYVEPSTEIEKAIAEIWCDVLGLDKVGVHDNFFEVGGHSLVATITITRIQNHFDINIPLSEIFRTPTIASIAKYIQIGLNLKAQLSSPANDNPDEDEVII